MPRKPMVTRTLQSTHCNIMLTNTTEGKIEYREFVFQGVVKNEIRELALAKKQLQEEGRKDLIPNCVVSTKYVGTLYGMSVPEFMEKAQIIDKPNKPSESLD